MWITIKHVLTRPSLRSTSRLVSLRTYASKNKNKNNSAPKLVSSKVDDPTPTKGSRAIPTSNLIPRSQRVITDEIAHAEYEKASAKMSSAVDWFRKETAALEARGIGRVTPSILDPVRVVILDGRTELRLEEVATIGVRDGTNLIVTLFDEQNTKYVEKAIYAAKVPNVVPQKVDERTIKIAIPRPTMETRAGLLTTASQTAEETRTQIRRTRDASVRKHKWKPRSDEVEQFQKLCDMKIKEVDQILSKVKKELGS